MLEGGVKSEPEVKVELCIYTLKTRTTDQFILYYKLQEGQCNRVSGLTGTGQRKKALQGHRWLRNIASRFSIYLF